MFEPSFSCKIGVLAAVTCRSGAVQPAETFDITKRLLTPSLAKPRQNAEAVLKTYELFVYEDTHRVKAWSQS